MLPMKEVMSSSDRIRILLLTLEYVDPIFSGNGILSRTVVEVLSQFAKSDILIVCGQPAGERVSHNTEIIDNGATIVTRCVTLSQWYKLDIDSSWEEYGKGVAQFSNDIRKFSPDIVLGVDWTSHLAYQTLQGELCARVCETIPFIFMNFRVFSKSSGISEEEKVFYQTRESNAIQESILTTVLCKNDASLLANLSGDPTNYKNKIRILNPPIRKEIFALSKQIQDKELLGISKFIKTSELKKTSGKDIKVDTISLPKEDKPNGTSSLQGSHALLSRPFSSTLKFSKFEQQNTPKRLYITCCSRICPEKRTMEFVNLLKQCSSYIRENGFVPFLVGPKTDERYAELVHQALRNEFPNKQCVIISGFVPPEQLAAIYERTIINIHPATYEAYGMVIAEAAAFGAPTLMDGGGGVGCADLLPAPRYSFYTDMKNSKVAGATLKTILRTSDQNMINVVRSLARDKANSWNNEAYCKGLRQVIDDALKKRFRAVSSNRELLKSETTSKEISNARTTKHNKTRSDNPQNGELSTDDSLWFRIFEWSLNFSNEQVVIRYNLNSVSSAVKQLMKKSAYDLASDLIDSWNYIQDQTRGSIEGSPTKSILRQQSMLNLQSVYSQTELQKVEELGYSVWQHFNEISDLNEVRFKLVPSIMPERAFWIILLRKIQIGVVNNLQYGEENPKSALVHKSFDFSTYSIATPDARERLACIEEIIQQDEGKRGIIPVAKAAGKDQLLQSAEKLLQSPHTIILSGFPCCMVEDGTTPQETDGPAGAIALALAISGVGQQASVLVENLNASPFHAAAVSVFGKGKCIESTADGCSYPTRRTKYNHGLVVIEEFPSSDNWTRSCDERLSSLYQEVNSQRGVVVAIERAGPGMDGLCRTMTGRILGTDKLAPLDRLFVMFEVEQRICIGDGGNELGMGAPQVVDAIHQSIRNGEKVACTTEAGIIIVCSVSNWGGYALSAAIAILAADCGGMDTIERALAACLGTEDVIRDSIVASVEQGGAKDGVTNTAALTVDGFPLSKNINVYKAIVRSSIGIK